ncbi:Protein CBG26790 [Caenorhabditis briggsae]|uniref:Protein CBG26790 n=2 Tax=Caenorhabditis briggsae TaxID=6238 RepID=B6IHA2_CAEBR|nr:Protein CBG26790 [Caenorhabditis briggsae]ULT85201.1 hypothetical protein L3Y34_013746 [Caenorhabditis briggsae]CAR99282.1 Protein CBG26790 [Caenorhabditis briggsae]
MSLDSEEDEIKTFKAPFEISDPQFRDFIVSHLVSGQEETLISSKSSQTRIYPIFTFGTQSTTRKEWILNVLLLRHTSSTSIDIFRSCASSRTGTSITTRTLDSWRTICNELGRKGNN